MKKKGLGWAVISTILGIMVVLIFAVIMVKLYPSSKNDVCANNVAWGDFKEKLNAAEDGIPSTTFFKNGNCYLVSFSLENINSFSPKIKPPSEIKQKQKPAICLCNLNRDECGVNNYFKDCYIFNELNDITPYNSGDDVRKDKNYIFIAIKKQDSNLEIIDDIKTPEPITQNSQPAIIPGSPIFLPEQNDQIA